MIHRLMPITYFSIEIGWSRSVADGWLCFIYFITRWYFYWLTSNKKKWCQLFEGWTWRAINGRSVDIPAWFPQDFRNLRTPRWRNQCFPSKQSPMGNICRFALNLCCQSDGISATLWFKDFQPGWRKGKAGKQFGLGVNRRMLRKTKMEEATHLSLQAGNLHICFMG